MSLMVPVYSRTVVVAMVVVGSVTSWRGRPGRPTAVMLAFVCLRKIARTHREGHGHRHPGDRRDAPGPARRGSSRAASRRSETKANGTRYFQQSVIIWSTRMRGSVQRIQTITLQEHERLHDEDDQRERSAGPTTPRPGSGAGALARPRRSPASSPGTCQPPKKSVVATAAITQRLPELHQEVEGEAERRSTRRGSRRRARTRPRGGRTGVRLPSASCAMKKMTKATAATGFVKMNHSQGQAALRADDPLHRERARHQHRDHDRDAGGDLVGDDLRGGAHAAEERPLGVGGPAGEEDARRPPAR